MLSQNDLDKDLALALIHEMYLRNNFINKSLFLFLVVVIM